jgi:hypothetical protein
LRLEVGVYGLFSGGDGAQHASKFDPVSLDAALGSIIWRRGYRS